MSDATSPSQVCAPKIESKLSQVEEGRISRPVTAHNLPAENGGTETVTLDPSLEAALWREYAHGHERLMAWRSTHPSRPRYPSRYENWSAYIQAALADWLHGPVPAWPGEALR